MKSKNIYYASANFLCHAKCLKPKIKKIDTKCNVACSKWQEGCRNSILLYFFLFLFCAFRFWIAYNWHLRECQQPSRLSRLCTCHTWLPLHDCIYPSIQSCHCWTFDVLCYCCFFVLLCMPFSAAIRINQLFDLWLTRFCAKISIFSVLLFAFFFCLSCFLFWLLFFIFCSYFVFVCCCRCRFKYG